MNREVWEMKKLISIVMAVCLALSISACGAGSASGGKQTASAYLDQSEAAVIEATVDLSGGWSVEFARGAIYLYDGEITEGKECIAMLVTLDQEVYGEHLAEAQADKDHKEADGGIYFTYYENEAGYVASLDDTAFFLITTTDKKNVESIVSRFSLKLD